MPIFNDSQSHSYADISVGLQAQLGAVIYLQVSLFFHIPGGLPRLDQLRSFQLRDNKSIDIAQKIVLNYDQFTTLLLEDDDGTEMAVIRGTVGTNPVNIVVAVLTQWLRSGSATWGSLVGTLRKTKLDALANQIESMNRVKNI